MFVSIILAYPFAKNLMEGKTVMAEWGLIAFVGLFFLKNKWLKAWTIWLLVCLIGQYNKYSYYEMNMVFIYLVAFQVMIDRLTDKHIHWIYNSIAVVILCHIAFEIMQYFDFWWLYALKKNSIGGGHILGTMGQNGNAGVLVAIGLPVFLRRRWCWLLPLVLWGLFLPKSAVGVVAGLSGLVLYAFMAYPRFRWPIIAIIAGLFAFYAIRFERSSFSGLGERLEGWRQIFNVMKGTPSISVKGLGLGQFRVTFYVMDRLFLRPDFGANLWKAHNEYIELVYNIGLIGFGLMMGYIGSTIERYLKSQTKLGFIALIGVVITLISCLGHWSFHMSAALISVFFMSVLENQIRRKA